MNFPVQYRLLTLSAVAMFFAWGAWGLVLNKMSPFASPEMAIPLFYGASALVAFFSFFVFSLFFRLAFFGEKTVAHHTASALRQGFLFALLALGILVFRQFRLLTPAILIMILSMILLIEAFFWRRKRR